MNIGSRLWAPENVDVNRRFPGDENGSTTERIAYALMDKLRPAQIPQTACHSMCAGPGPVRGGVQKFL